MGVRRTAGWVWWSALAGFWRWQARGMATHAHRADVRAQDIKRKADAALARAKALREGA